jgi:hypothetical protein
MIPSFTAASMSTGSRFVFISYAREDGTAPAVRLSEALTRAGHHAWRDREELASRLGELWEDELTEQLLSADAVVVVLTREAVRSPYVKGEIQTALGNGIAVLPVLFGATEVPLGLVARQHVDFTEDFEAGMASLLASLEHVRPSASDVERDRKTLERLLANRERATRQKKDVAAIDARIAVVRARVDTLDADLRAQANRVDRGIAEEKSRSLAESTRQKGPGVRRFGRRPVTAIGEDFHDRVDQQAAVAAALYHPRTRMVTILGRGGMGKTALACAVLDALEQNAPTQDPYAPALRGIAWVLQTPTHPISLDRVLLYIARILPDEAAEDAERVFANRDLSIEDRIDRFLELVPDGLFVALLDNFEDLLDERGHIRDLEMQMFIRRVLADRGALRLLITARAAINLPAAELRGERQITLHDGLPDADAVALLRALDPNEQQLGLANASESSLLTLVRKTYGIPRALELIPNILAGNEGTGLLHGLEQIADEFWTRENVVQNLVEVNYRNLRPVERRVAEALAIYGRPVAPVAVDFLLQPYEPGLRLDDVLQPLVNRRLVSIARSDNGEHTTLGLHRIDCDFLSQQLPNDGVYSRRALHRRAAEFYRTQRSVGVRGWRNITELLPQILEYEHLVLAGDYDEAAILLGQYAGGVAHCGHPTYCRDLFAKLPAREVTTPHARFWYGLTTLIWKAYLGPISDGLRAGEETLRLALTLDDPLLELHVRKELVTGYRYAANSARSSEHAEKLLAQAEAHPDAIETIPVLEVAFDLVLAYSYGGDVRRAAPLAEQFREVAARSGKPELIATALNGLTLLYFAWGRYADSVRFGREAEDAWMPGFHDGIAYVKNLIGMANYLLGDYPAAVRKLREAAQVADEWNSPRPEALALWNLSLINLLHGVYDDALKYGRQAEELMMRLGLEGSAQIARVAADAASREDHSTLAASLLAAARESTRCGDLLPGLTLVERAKQIAGLHGPPTLAAEADTLAAELHARQKLPESV